MLVVSKSYLLVVVAILMIVDWNAGECRGNYPQMALIQAGDSM